MNTAVEQTIGFKIRRAILENWDRPALTEYTVETVTYGELGRQIARVHAQLAAVGVKPGDRVALIGRSTIGWAAVYFGVVTYGAVIVPILNDFKGSTVNHIVNHSEAKVFYVAESHWEALGESSMPSVEAFISIGTGRILYSKQKEVAARDWGIPAMEKADFEALPIRYTTGEELAEINYTSGTTGFSKGVMQPFRSLESNVQFAEGVIPVQPGDTVISVLPLAHAYGQAFEFLYCFTRGCHIHFISKTPSPKVIAQAFAEIKPRIILIVPLIMEKIYKQHILKQLNRRGMRLLMRAPVIGERVKRKFCDALSGFFGDNFLEVIIGGAALNPEVELFLKRIGFRYTVGYGMTECAPIITYASWDTHRLHSTGRVVVNMELRINEPNSETGVGEVVVRGKNVMLGYYRDPALTEEVFTPDGWLRTGDLAYLDAEGNLFIKGRSKNMILGPSGQNIYPEEVEAVLNSQPYIQESLVAEQDGKLVALVVPDFVNASADGVPIDVLEARFEEVRKAVNKELPAYSQIAAIQLYPEEFEKTPKKSIKRFMYALNPLKH